MRIIAGTFKGRILKDPKGHRTHPMAERVRGALFNTLGDLHGKVVLDAFAGSGAVAIEALSRGAARVVAVEIDNACFGTLKENRNLVTDENTLPVHRANVVSWLTGNTEQFDIVICDPPYDNVVIGQLDTIVDKLKPGGLLVLSVPPGIIYTNETLTLLRKKSYGDASLWFYTKTAP